MWLDEQDAEVFRVWAKNASVPLLVSGMAGEIFWANQAFEEWSGYTLSELRILGWKKLSQPDDSLEADMKALAEVVDGYRTHYTVQKYYIPKGEKPQAGELTAVRYPADGPIKFFLCTWQPLRNGTAAAFDLAIRHIGEVDRSVTQLAHEVRNLTQRNDDEEWVLRTWRIGWKYPKIVLLLITVFLGMNGLNTFLEVIQRFHAVGVPVPPALKNTDVMQLPQQRQFDAVAKQIVNTKGQFVDGKATTPGGSVVEWRSEDVGGLSGRMGRGGLGSSGSRFISGGG